MTWIDCRGWSLIADAAVFTGKLPGLSACVYLSFMHCPLRWDFPWCL